MSFPPGARHQPDGSIVFPCRGKAPDCNVPGYEPDPFDPYKWNMLYKPCTLRLINHTYTCSSGRKRTGDYCTLHQCPITPRYCNVDCKDRNEAESSEASNGN